MTVLEIWLIAIAVAIILGSIAFHHEPSDIDKLARKDRHARM
jgi:hypothetical protein